MQHTGDVKDIADVIAAAFGRLPGSVLVEPGDEMTADTAFVQVYRTPSQARHHHRRPPLLYGQPLVAENPPEGDLSPEEYGHLRAWAFRYSASWDAMRRYPAGSFDVDRFIRRFVRLRAGIEDAAPRAAAGRIAQILTDEGLTHESLPEDLARLAGLDRPVS